MDAVKTLRFLLMVGVLPLVVGACLSSPPRSLPSSVRVLYSKATQDTVTDRTDIYFVVARAGNELRLTGEEGVDRQPTYAPGLRRVFFTRRVDGRDEIWSMEFNGTDEVRVVGDENADFADPAVSPDERHLAYVRTVGGRTEIRVAGVDGSEPRLVVGGNANWRGPKWSPDGETLALASNREGVSRLFLVDVSGGDPRPLAPADGGAQDHPDWSPDGTQIVFTRGTGTDAEIAVADASTGEVRRLTDNNEEDIMPAWSPAGDRIVFVSHRPKGRYNLWLVNADGSDVVPLTRSEGSDARDPEWL